MLLALADRVANYNSRNKNGGGGEKEQELITVILVTIFVVAFLLIIGRILWDQVLTRLVTVVKPCDSVWDILGLYILISLLFAK